MFQSLSQGKVLVSFCFCLVNLFTLEQIFAVVKIRHSSLILKEVLLIFTSKTR